MATLVVTPGSASANSYCTYAEATLYHETRYLNDEWLNKGQADCEKALMWATRLMDQLNWLGAVVNASQALRWPRVGCVNREGFILNSATIPQVIKEACAEWAFYLLTEDRTLDEGGLVEIGGKVGPITNPSMYQRKPIPDGVREMLEPYARLTTGVGRVYRV